LFLGFRKNELIMIDAFTFSLGQSAAAWNDRFAGRVAIVTGAASGLGQGIAFRLAREGAKVALVDVNGEQLDRTAQEFQRHGLSALPFVTDVSDEASVQAQMTRIEQAMGPPDVMVHSAGIVGPTNTSIVDYPVEAFDSVYAVNLRGSFLITKHVVAAMLPQKSGRILLIASVAGKEGNPRMCGYSATKAGVIGLVKGVAKEYAEQGITINGLAPAVVMTDMVRQTAPEQVAYMTSKIPMKRLGTIEEVAAMATFVVSNECSFSTGFIFDLTGGRSTY
jgi:NAD(P)-dependent dehydrogenase (short-subunit alcohol dehydrogenase family)